MSSKIRENVNTWSAAKFRERPARLDTTARVMECHRVACPKDLIIVVTSVGTKTRPWTSPRASRSQPAAACVTSSECPLDLRWKGRVCDRHRVVVRDQDGRRPVPRACARRSRRSTPTSFPRSSRTASMTRATVRRLDRPHDRAPQEADFRGPFEGRRPAAVSTIASLGARSPSQPPPAPARGRPPGPRRPRVRRICGRGPS